MKVTGQQYIDIEISDGMVKRVILEYIKERFEKPLTKKYEDSTEFYYRARDNKFYRAAEYVGGHYSDSTYEITDLTEEEKIALKFKRLIK